MPGNKSSKTVLKRQRSTNITPEHLHIFQLTTCFAKLQQPTWWTLQHRLCDDAQTTLARQVCWDVPSKRTHRPLVAHSVSCQGTKAAKQCWKAKKHQHYPSTLDISQLTTCFAKLQQPTWWTLQHRLCDDAQTKTCRAKVVCASSHSLCCSVHHVGCWSFAKQVVSWKMWRCSGVMLVLLCLFSTVLLLLFPGMTRECATNGLCVRFDGTSQQTCRAKVVCASSHSLMLQRSSCRLLKLCKTSC